MDTILSIFDHPFFTIRGGFSTVILILGVLIRFFMWVFNISPIVIRLGNALWKRNVAIFGSDTAFHELNEILTESSIFKKGKIAHIRENNFEKAKDFSLYLIDWNSCKIEIEKILNLRKNHQIGIVVFARPRSIDDENMELITNSANTIVVNARGRLINDMFTLLITTKYDN